MKRTVTFMLSLLCVVALACADGSETVVENEAASTIEETGINGEELSPEELAEISAEIRKNPDDVQQILTDRGLTEEQFEEQIRAVAADPKASDEYAERFREADTGA